MELLIPRKPDINVSNTLHNIYSRNVTYFAIFKIKIQGVLSFSNNNSNKMMSSFHKMNIIWLCIREYYQLESEKEKNSELNITTKQKVINTRF